MTAINIGHGVEMRWDEDGHGITWRHEGCRAWSTLRLSPDPKSTGHKLVGEFACPTSVECPTCSSWVGWACKGARYGYHAAGYHPARHDAARAKIAPLTIVGSLLCAKAGCGAHGYIRDGVWVPA